jgi:lipopolysaccharide/colanic/teichoic acid biosynthesis glycosyltransferase
MHLASSILSTRAGGRVVTVRAEPGADFDSSLVHSMGNGTGQLELDPAEELCITETWDGSANFLVDPFSTYIGGAEEFGFCTAFPRFVELPTRGVSYQVGKRIFDLALAVAISPILTVMIGIISAMIALTAGGPIFFRQRRIGQHGREFAIWKFRTMSPRADSILTEHLKQNSAAREEWNQTHKLREDPRITRLGRMLRKTSLDELPQILNVFAGDMSFVGPRPIVRAERPMYAERYPYYLAAVPGVTGLWQVSGRSDVTYEARTILDETYVCKWTLARDIWILLKTPRAVVNRDGAY